MSSKGLCLCKDDREEYRRILDSVKKIASGLKKNGRKVGKEDKVYIILIGLSSKYFLLVVILFNTYRNELLTLTGVMDAIVIEDIRLKELYSNAGKGNLI